MRPAHRPVKHIGLRREGFSPRWWLLTADGTLQPAEAMEPELAQRPTGRVCGPWCQPGGRIHTVSNPAIRSVWQLGESCSGGRGKERSAVLAAACVQELVMQHLNRCYQTYVSEETLLNLHGMVSQCKDRRTTQTSGNQFSTLPQDA
ncbi:PREDICTED: uncharacterized protein LOC106892722 isoform X2 [Calidris pugnax]|uniref:uncharacterized protein LOC106892722 isoform X2 n=1 Tax=Calidris pugnax TaxID=198806 RepID=UPI00071D4FAD|nr:PREDICTED: uncharacterized protein LOC106892722 isoform X2 [Calidris pugnax]XP_014805624.1 PREDICTED: uncharacterized protein LOC106892722 isoform X2 [Calidris pugnax]